MELPEPVLEYIAENITANVRQIEGTVNKIMALRELEGNDVDTTTVVRAVRDMFKDKSDILPSSDVIIREVCKFYGIDEEALRGQSRVKDTATARQVAMYLVRVQTNLFLHEIGQQFGGRDHSTALHAIKRIEKQVKDDAELAEIVKDIKANINAHYE